MTVDYFESHLREVVEEVFYKIYETEPGDSVESAYIDKYGITALIVNPSTDYSEYYVWTFDSKFFKEIKKIVKEIA